VDTVLRGAEQAGALTEKVILNDLEIVPCQACDVACEETGECIQQDDMVKVVEQMQRSEIWVLGTPVYWWGPTAQFKAFLDRWVGVRKTTFKGRRIILAIPLGDANVHTARHTVGMLTDSVKHLGMELVATLLAPGTMNRRQVRQYPQVLTAAYRAGREAIQK
jgi:multimeric flavodoxin WrbA